MEGGGLYIFNQSYWWNAIQLRRSFITQRMSSNKSIVFLTYWNGSDVWISSLIVGSIHRNFSESKSHRWLYTNVNAILFGGGERVFNILIQRDSAKGRNAQLASKIFFLFEEKKKEIFFKEQISTQEKTKTFQIRTIHPLVQLGQKKWQLSKFSSNARISVVFS